jgi:hypothetical protein
LPRPSSNGIVTATRAPTLASVGNPYIIVELTPQALARCSCGLDVLWGAYQWLDRAPLGRNEKGPRWKRRDEYGGR